MSRYTYAEPLFLSQLDSQYLTHRSTRVNIQNVIDQMFEDLNSYSETSITIDGINYLELKLFPFYRESTFRSVRVNSRESNGFA